MTRVFTVAEANSLTYEEGATPSMESKVQIEMDAEKNKHSLQKKRIMKILKDIVLNTLDTLDVITFKKFILYSIVGILAPFGVLCWLTLIPLNDFIQYPESWYSIMGQQLVVIAGLIPLLSIYAIMNCAAWMNVSGIQNTKNIVKGSLNGAICLGIVYSTLVYWWTSSGYFLPVPFSGLIGGYVITIGVYLTVWYSFSKGWRKNGVFRKRLIYFLVALAMSQILTIQYNVLAKLLLVFKDNYQWIVALSLPMFAEFNAWIVTFLATKACCGDALSVEVTSSHMMGTRHALFLTYTLGSIATSLSSNIILATDFLINLSIVVRLIRLKKKDPMNVEKQIELLQELILNEMIEFMVPLVYCLVFSTAYFGPNAGLIGNVGNDYFHYNKVENFEDTIKNISIFFSVDVFSLLTNASILWVMARINVYKAICIYLKEYGIVFTINLSFILYTVSSNDTK